MQADEQVHPKSIALFIGDPGDEPDFVKGRRRSDRSDFQGISRQPGSMASALRVWKFNRLMQQKKENKREREGEEEKGTRYFTGRLFRSDLQRYIPPSLHADVFSSPPSDILSSTNRKTCQLRFSQSSRSAFYKELFRGERARMRAARRDASQARMSTRVLAHCTGRKDTRDTYANTCTCLYIYTWKNTHARTRAYGVCTRGSS